MRTEAYAPSASTLRSISNAARRAGLTDGFAGLGFIGLDELSARAA